MGDPIGDILSGKNVVFYSKRKKFCSPTFFQKKKSLNKKTLIEN
jgi:hypothetical protein